MARPCGAVFNPTTTNKHNKALKFCKHFCLVFKVVFMLLFFVVFFSKSSQLFQFKQHKQSYVMSFTQLIIANFIFFFFDFQCLNTVQQQQHPFCCYESKATPADCKEGCTHLRSNVVMAL